MSKYPLHPDFADIKDSGKPVSSKLLFKIANKISRKQTEAVPVDESVVKEKSYTVRAYKGADINVRIYSPADAEDGEALPCILNCHGGAFVGAWLPHQKGYCLFFAEKLHCRVIFADYRVAVDNPFPTPVEDCYAVLKWVADNCVSLGIDPARIAVFGDSAGGSLAAAVCLMSRDRNGPKICHQMLIYPVTDSSCSSKSAKEFTDVPEFNGLGNVVMWKWYLKNGDFGMPQYAAPLLADDLSGLPPAYVETAEFDCLHDEGVAYAEKLKAFGVEVELNETKGSYHGFDIKAERNYSKQMLAYRGEIMKKVFYG